MEALQTDVKDNPAKRRYELEVDGQIVFGDYRRDGEVLAVTHVEAPDSLRGTGAAGRFMQGLMDTARAENFKVRPLCGYAAAWLRRNPDYADLVA